MLAPLPPLQAVRKAPGQALGFRTLVTKWLILVRLLLGEIPERSEFTQKGLRWGARLWLHPLHIPSACYHGLAQHCTQLLACCSRPRSVALPLAVPAAKQGSNRSPAPLMTPHL